MFRSSLKITLRTLYRDKRYALINIAGLALAIACCLILGLYLRSELTYDQHNVQHERIFRVVNAFEDLDTGKQHREYAETSPVLGPMLAEGFAEVEAFVRLRPLDGETLMRHGGDVFYWKHVSIADDNLFDVFTHEILYGDPKAALVDPFSVAVSETFAKHYFGDANPMGEIIILENGEARKITLVFADLPENTHIKYDVLFSYNHESLAIDEADVGRWLFGVDTYTYLLMPPNYDPSAFGTISEAFFSRHMADRAAQVTNRAWSSWLQPLADIHLQSDLLYDEPTGNRFYLYGFAAVALFILLVACINYMNLATARSAKRAKEVGMRKVLGAGRLSLALQFLSESIVLSLLASALGVILVTLVLNATPIGDVLGKPLSLNAMDQPSLIWAMLGLTFVIGLGSSLYPAFYLSSIVPLSALVAGGKPGPKRVRLREFLVLVQFTISVGVIACTLLMALQMRFLAAQSLGFSKENRVLVTVRGQALIEDFPVLEDELAKNTRILGVSHSASMMGQAFEANSTRLETNTGTMQVMQVSHMAVADNFIDVMGMKIVVGRNFSAEIRTDDESALLVNEALVAYMGWEDPQGKRVRTSWGREGTVIGVVKDFNFKSLHTTVEPFVMYQPEFQRDVPPEARPFQQRLMVVNIEGEKVSNTLGFIRDTVSRFDTEHPFEYRFLDATLDQLYLSEQRLMRLIGIFSAICIFIACLGLFGLAAFTIEQRTKEIGIRKVLGATPSQIIGLLARKVLMLVLVGAVLASVIGYLAMDAWLSDFAYRTTINPLVFVISATLAVAVAYVTMALQSFRTARANPVHALRYE